MQRAVLVAPSASTEQASADASASSDAVAWLGAALAQRGFRVTVVDDADVPGEIARAAQGAQDGDVFFVHVSGRLARKGVLRAAGGRWLALRDVASALSSLPCDVCILAELRHEEEGGDALSAAEHVASVVAAMGARERGFTMVAAVRPASDDGAGLGPLAFTRLLLAMAEGSADTSADPATTLSAAYESVSARPEGLAAAQSFTLVRGRADVTLSTAAAAAPPPRPIPLPRPPPPAPAAPDLDALIAQATEARDWPRAVELRRSKLPTLPTGQARARELVAIARLLQAEMGEAEGAIGALEEARAMAPSRVGVLQALRRGYEKLGRWASAIEVVGALAGLEQSGPARAELRVSLATMVLQHLQDEDRAAALLLAALRDDPTSSSALAALQRLRPSAEAGGQPAATELVEEEPTGEHPVFHESMPSSERTPAPTGDPFDPATHAHAFEERLRAGHVDAAYLSALVLEDLGATRPEHIALIEKRRTTMPIRPRSPLDDAGWSRLRARGSDDILEALFGAVSRASSAARVEQLIARDRLVTLDPAARIDEKSTASVWRTFQWAAHILSVPCPDIYVVGEVPGDIAAVRAPVPSTAVGPAVIGGRSAKELAFLTARHLTYYRPEHAVLIYFPTHDEIERLVLATVELAVPGATGAIESRAVAALKARLERHVTPKERAAVTDAAQRLVARGGKAGLARWARSVELTAGRAGLFVCGDLATATATVNLELRGVGGLSGEERRKDLLSFAGSEAFASLRSDFVLPDVQP